MARSRLTNTTDDLITDSGATLWSIVRGEQLEFPVTLPFVEDVTDNYTYEAVVVEAANEDGQTIPPTSVQTPTPVVSVLGIRVPTNRGAWQSNMAYNREELATDEGLTYRLIRGAGRISAVQPKNDPDWMLADLNTIYLQFPKTLGSNWTLQPKVGSPTYGFFELRVTEPSDPIFSRTWKPVRGMVELLFSPTYSVDD